MSEKYTYGDNDRAIERLRFLAQAYEVHSAALLEQARVHAGSIERVLDVGAGPGYTTELVQRVTGARSVWGLDNSARMVDRARSRLGPPFRFEVHEATVAPYPVGDVDLTYARFLLAHVTSPSAVLHACALATRAGGVLVLEESCSLESEDALFSDYYARVSAMQRHYGQDLYIGHRLAELGHEAEWSLVSHQRTPLAMDAAVMARLHAMNVRTWKDDPVARAQFDEATLATMMAELDATASGKRAAPPVRCVMGQVVLVRRGLQ
jgi:ubiquinone/menaquinone biosynthesis C-methylase UbiE